MTVKPYNTGQTKKEEVREMFDNIAPKYDLLNHTLSMNIDRIWRRRVVRIVRRSMNPRLELEGVLLTMFDGRTNLAIQVAQEIKRFFPGKVYSTVIPRNIRLSEAPSHGKPIHAYDRTCRGAEAYSALADEFLRKNGIGKEE